MNLLDHLVTLLLRAARFEANLGHPGAFQTLSCVLGISRGVLAVACQFWYQFVTVLDTSAVIRLQVHFSVDFSEIFDKFGVPF